MSFDLKSIKKTRRDVPPRILIYGPHKIGKSTWASQAPAPIFVPTEDGQDAIDAEAFPLCHTWDDVLSCVSTLYTGEHEYSTVVLDSADWAERLVRKYVCDDHEKDSIEEFGYGKGYVYAAEAFGELLDGLNALRLKRGMMIILICHAEIRRFDDPQADSYDRYQIKLHKLVGKLVQEWADVIGFAQQDATTKTEENKNNKKEKGRTRVIDTARRSLHLGLNAAYDAGNRFDLPPTLPLVWSEFETALKNAKEQ